VDGSGGADSKISGEESPWSGRGGHATSYSGGPGGGVAERWRNGSEWINGGGTQGSDVGGAGGNRNKYPLDSVTRGAR